MSEIPEPDRRIAVVRDNTFHRFTADRIIVTDLGRELEVAFLQIGPLYSEAEVQDDGEELSAQSVLTEVSRMRITYGSYMNALMNFIRSGIQEDKLNGQGIIDQIAEWVKEISEGDEA